MFLERKKKTILIKTKNIRRTPTPFPCCTTKTGGGEKRSRGVCRDAEGKHDDGYECLLFLTFFTFFVFHRFCKTEPKKTCISLTSPSLVFAFTRTTTKSKELNRTTQRANFYFCYAYRQLYLSPQNPLSLPFPLLPLSLSLSLSLSYYVQKTKKKPPLHIHSTV